MRKILFIAAFFLLIFSATSAQAASGCCKIIKETAVYEITAFQEVYMTMQSEDCDKQKGPNTEVTFEEGKVASADSKSCEDATGTTGESQPSKPIAPQLQVSLPGFEKFSDVTCDNPEVICEIPWIAEYIKAFYNYGLAIIGILSVIVMMIGAIIRITAGGNNAQISHGNQYIKGSILGIIFAFCSYSILFLLNPNLTILKPINVSHFEKIDLPELDSPDEGNGSESLADGEVDPQCLGTGGINDLNSIAHKYTENKVTYRYGASGGNGTQTYGGHPLKCPPGQLCFDCSNYIRHLLSCVGKTGPSGSTADIFAGKEKVTSATSTSINGIELKPGELIGWPKVGSGNTGHVVIYIGNGEISQTHGGSGWNGDATSISSFQSYYSKYSHKDMRIVRLR